MSHTLDEKNGGEAFPVGNGNSSGTGSGMSLRDWFAGQALAGLCSAMPLSFFDQMSIGQVGGKFYAENAYALADKMIEARKK